MARNGWTIILVLFILWGCEPNRIGIPADQKTPAETPDESPAENSISLSESEWDVIYDGYGSVTFEDGLLTLAPKASAPGEVLMNMV